MKTIIMSDMHLGKFWKSNNSIFNRGRKLIQYFKYNLESVYNTLKDDKDLQLIIAGDFFDAVHVNVELLIYIKSQLYDILQRFPYRNIIAGNHEIFIDKNGVQQSLIDIAFPITASTYINKVESIYYNEGNINYIFIPYMNDIEKFIDDGLNMNLKKGAINIIIGHFTPKEIFSYAKFTINDIIDKYSNDYMIPYILLGHYHKPLSYKYNKTYVISISNSYYHTIMDITDTLTNDINLQKRYIIIDHDSMKIYLRPYLLPKIDSYDIEDQEAFNKMIDIIKHNHIDNKVDENSILYIKSRNLIDYSQLTFDGYDIYFDYIEDIDNSIISLNDIVYDNIDIKGVHQSLTDRWNTYIDLLSDKNASLLEKKVATWLFNKRDDLSVTVDNIIAQLDDK